MSMISHTDDTSYGTFLVQMVFHRLALAEVTNLSLMLQVYHSAVESHSSVQILNMCM
jgi:hypothetical protein